MAANREVRAALFDWDGTLADSAENTFRCYREVFASFGIPYDRERFRETYAPDWTFTYRAIGLPEESWAEADRRWLAAYAEQPGRLLAGARECLEALRPRVALGLVTSGDRRRVSGELARHGLEGLFAVTVFGGETERGKPHPDPLVLALERLGVAPAAALFVGDSPDDIRMARSAGVRALAIPGGYPNEGPLRASRPDLWADRLDEATPLLVRLTG